MLTNLAILCLGIFIGATYPMVWAKIRGIGSDIKNIFTDLVDMMKGRK